MVSSPTRERCLLSNHAAGSQKRVCIFALSASIAAQLPLVGGRRLSRSPTAATAAAGPRRRPRGCWSSSQRLPLATRGVRDRVWGRVVHRLDAGRAQRPPVGAARASEAVALWAFRGAPIASRSSATLTLAHRRYTRSAQAHIASWEGACGEGARGVGTPPLACGEASGGGRTPPLACGGPPPAVRGLGIGAKEPILPPKL